MGQYYKVANLDKHEYLNAWALGDGAKLWELVANSGGLLSALAILLADGNGRGGGDIHELENLHPKNNIAGRWAGNRIVLCGDYGDDGKFTDRKGKNLYHTLDEEDTGYRDISLEVRAILIACNDEHIVREISDLDRSSWDDSPTRESFLKPLIEKVRAGEAIL